jgi:glycosyltransferase involved in cell wall biosynthesis
MKISIWFKITEKPWGGGNQFLRALARNLELLGHEVFNHPTSSADVILLNSHNRGPNLYLNTNQVAQLRSIGRINWWGKIVSQKIWTRIPRKGPPILHRLDGVAALIRGHRTNADILQFGINPLCDYTIFQSAYSKESFLKFGIIPSKSKIVHNGVDGNIFYPAQSTRSVQYPIRLAAVSWSPNLRKGFSTLAEISNILNVELSFIGHWPPEIAPNKTILLGVKNSTEIAEILRQSDAFIHASENENCSNAILEALACGLPVLYKDSGGNRELAKDYGIPLTKELENNLSDLMINYHDYRQKLLVDRSKFLIEDIARRYLDVFEDAIQMVKKYEK